MHGRADHTVAITPEDIISWGGNSYGQCGQGERAEVMSVKPRSIKPLQGISVAQIVCGRYHTLCVSATSQVRPAAFLIKERSTRKSPSRVPKFRCYLCAGYERQA